MTPDATTELLGLPFRHQELICCRALGGGGEGHGEGGEGGGRDGSGGGRGTMQKVQAEHAQKGQWVRAKATLQYVAHE